MGTDKNIKLHIVTDIKEKINKEMPSLVVSNEAIQTIGKSLRDVNKPLKDRFRSLFTLKNIGTDDCVKEISLSFNDESSLLKHELAYCLGQMRKESAIPILSSLLEDNQQETIVRHEAGEALGAIGCQESLPLLEKYSKHHIPEIAETCQLAVGRINWLLAEKNQAPNQSEYDSVDPAPPMVESNISDLEKLLLDEKENLFIRYKAMFALRNKGGEHSVLSLSKGLKSSSALFRHEIAFVLGQMSHKASIPFLKESLQNQNEQGMVRHECAEALGAIATEECFEILKSYTNDKERVVKESCDVALDMCEYESSDQFQYANALSEM